MLFARLSEACLSRGRHTTPPPFVTFGVINRAGKVVMCESSGRFIRQRSTAATGKVGASGLDDAEDRAERWKRIEPPPAANWTTFKNSPLVTHRRNATRQCRRERRRILLIDDYEAAFARLECIKKGSRAMYAIHATTRLDASRRDATRTRDLRGGLNISATRRARVRRREIVLEESLSFT